MSRLLNTTPRQDGFRIPAESDSHDACWMLFPFRPDVWRENARPAQAAFARVTAAISQFEPVIMGVKPGYEAIARQIVPQNIKIVSLEYDDCWMRDTGASFVVNDRGELRGVEWGFNAWGGLYASWENDGAVARQMLEMTNADRYQADFVLEGGSIDYDGDGTLYTTAECLLNPNRNPHLSQSEIEQRLQDYANVEKVMWLNRGVYEDETSGHIDNLCRVVRPGEVVLTWTNDRYDPQYEISQEVHDHLMSETDAKGRKIRVHKIHQPDPMFITEVESQGIEAVEGNHPRRTGQRLAASYVNFYVANSGVIVPQFDDSHDHDALQVLQDCFPGHQIVGVPGREILLGGGNIHCITQQQPCP